LRSAERFSGEITRQVRAGEEVLVRLAQIASAARTLEAQPSATASPPPAARDVKATAVAAQAFAARARLRLRGAAA
jgi:hypothetical protein